MCSTLIKKTYRFITASLTAALCVTVLAAQASAADSKTFRWSSAGDFLTFDVHAQNESLNSAANAAVYESLVRYSPEMKIEPALATQWKRVNEGFVFTIR